tara:strand:- start:4401 stop:6704 length:2304 start_codon:yes stop_codon:yes gene_type:complete
MTDFFIFQYSDKKHFENECSITVLFVNQKQYENHKSLVDTLETFFLSNLLSDKLIILLPGYCDNQIRSYFTDKILETFNRVPRFNENYKENHCFIYFFDNLGNFQGDKSILDFIEGKDIIDFFDYLKRNGSTQIFKSRGGLIESSPDHHFVFPSRKHSEKFIRTGNVLVHSSEIFFVAFQLLSKFESIDSIYCDTSSINVLPFAVFELKRRFGDDFHSIPINSFESYNVFESLTSSFSRKALVLISSSTSGNIISRLVDESIAHKNQILVLYFLGPIDKYIHVKENIICNITYDKIDFAFGVEIFKTYKNTIECKLCENYSTPIEITGDVFLSVKPKIKSIVLKKSDAPKFLSSFMYRYRANNELENIFRAYYGYGDNGSMNYEVFIDTSLIMELITNPKSSSYFKSKLHRKIGTNVSAQTKYILHLPDPGSIRLVNYILDVVDFKTKPEVKSLKNFEEIKDKQGSILVVGSSLVTGRYYLHISRLLRKFNKLGASYIIGILRSMSQDYNNSTKSNLGQGEDGGQTFPVHTIEEIYCSPRMENNYWDAEKEYFENLIGGIDEDENIEFTNYIKNRVKTLRDSRKNGGLNNNVFLPMYNNNILTLRRGFVFWNFKYNCENAYQSKVFFTISTVLNHLVNQSVDSERSLKQTNYVRNLISPDNFKRFNDGIIQSSIIRAGRRENFLYNLDNEESFNFKVLMISMIDAFNDEHGEALPEFLLSIALKKIRLKRKHLKSIFMHAKENLNDPILSPFFKYVELELSNADFLA